MTNVKKLADAAETKADAILNPVAVPGHNMSPATAVLWKHAMTLGKLAAAGQSAVTKLAFGYQELCRQGAASEADAGKLYLHHVQGHNAWVAANPEMGAKSVGTTEKELKSNVSTFRTFARKGPRELGEGLYMRVRLIRQHSIPESEWAQKSTYNAYVKVNRMVADLCEKVAVGAFPPITDAMLVEWLTKKPTATDDLATAFAAMLKAVEARPNDVVLAESFKLVARYMTLKAVKTPDLKEVCDQTAFTWVAPIVKDGPVEGEAGRARPRPFKCNLNGRGLSAIIRRQLGAVRLSTINRRLQCFGQIRGPKSVSKAIIWGLRVERRAFPKLWHG